jgi:hypothetical protein
MKHAVEMGPVAMIYVLRFINISSAIQNFIGEIHRHPDNMEIAEAYFH